MRLIDADAIVKDWSRYDPDRRFTMEGILIAIEIRPTVDAIPIGWIEERIRELYASKEYDGCYDCAWDLSELVKKWRAENGDPNGFNEETVQVLKDATERKNLSKVYETLDDMYADMDVSEWREYIYRVRETADGEDSDRMAELIRCRDCKRWNTKDGMFKDFDERQWHECPYLGVPTDEWFFCRDAEREEDDNG